MSILKDIKRLSTMASTIHLGATSLGRSCMILEHQNLAGERMFFLPVMILVMGQNFQNPTPGEHQNR